MKNGIIRNIDDNKISGQITGVTDEAGNPYNGGQIDFRDSGFPSKGINVNDSVSFNVQDPGPVAIELVKKD